MTGQINKRNTYAIGDTWEATNRGITYLMQKQEKGKAKAIKRITPYVVPKRANSLSGIPPSGDSPIKVLRKRKTVNLNHDVGINQDKDIKMPKFDPLLHKMVKVDGKTYKQVNR